jgi:voltage-gated potassium channel
MAILRREPVVLSLGQGRARVAYDAAMIALALLVVVLLLVDDVGWVRVVNLVIWAVFVADYALRLALSTDKRAFVKANVVDLLAILPADQFRALRMLRVLRLVRGVTVLTRVLRDLRGIRETNGLGWVLFVAGGAISVSAAAVRFLEPTIDSWPDAFWWATVTATTVGYGDISPESGAARVVAVVLMLVGIGTIGMLTASIATYFLGGGATATSAHIEHLQALLARWDDLSDSDRRAAAALLTSLAKQPSEIVPTLMQGTEGAGEKA